MDSTNPCSRGCTSTNEKRFSDRETVYIYLLAFKLRPDPRGRALNKRLNIQRRLAWSLSKNDTHNRREANFFFQLPFYVALRPSTKMLLEVITEKLTASDVLTERPSARLTRTLPWQKVLRRRLVSYRRRRLKWKGHREAARCPLRLFKEFVGAVKWLNLLCRSDRIEKTSRTFLRENRTSYNLIE